MTGQATSLGVAHSVPRQWREFGAFLRHPVLPPTAQGISGSAFPRIASLAGLDLLLMLLLIGSLGLASAMGWQAPQHAMEELKVTPFLIGFIVLAGPIVEELVFRSWLSGRPGHVAGIIVMLAAGAGAYAASHIMGGTSGTLAAGGIVVLGLVVAILIVWMKRNRPAMEWFARNFVFFYWASAILFALAHVINFASGSGPIVFALVLPQFLLGLILGYLRVNVGLWSSMLLHAVHNTFFIALAMLGSGVG